MNNRQLLFRAFFGVLRSAVYDEPLSDNEKALLNAETLPVMVKIAKRHDLTHLLAYGLKKNNLLSEALQPLENEIFKAIFRYERTRTEYDALCKALEEAQIPFLPLKGSVIRRYYPEAWMRTSCDIDILVHENDCEKAKNVLTDMLGYVFHEKGSHDISLFSPSNVHVELHYDLVEDGIANASSSILKNIWNVSSPRSGYTFFYEMPDDHFYFYHVAHMAKHFENGGCGIRPFIDLSLLDNITEADTEKRDALLDRGMLLKFAGSVRTLSRIWLSGAEYDPISTQLESYILRGGVYGSNENHIIVQQQKKGGRIKYALSKIFLPYKILKFHYPILQKHRWLTPIMEIRRWFKLIFCGHLKRSAKELKYNSSVSEDTAANIKSLLNSIGL